MLQNPRKTLGFKKNMVYKIPPRGGGGKPYPASGLITMFIPIVLGPLVVPQYLLNHLSHKERLIYKQNCKQLLFLSL